MLYSLEERYFQEIQSERNVVELLSEGKIASLNNACDGLWYKYEIFGIYNISIEIFDKAKFHFNTCGLIDEYRVNKYNSIFLDYGIHHICYAILSDNEDMILRYSELRYKPWGKMKGMEENILLGKDPIWCNIIQMFMANDSTGIERNLNILDTITLKKKKEQSLMLDYEFYKALYYNDKSRMEEVLEIFVSPKIHKKRNGDPIFNKYISLPALGYAKLAWRKGIEVEVNSPLIPKELLPVQPLEKYEIPYDFLKEK
jgi:hypothetical protein